MKATKKPLLNPANLLDKPQDEVWPHRDTPEACCHPTVGRKALLPSPAPHSPGRVISVALGHPQQRSFALPKESRHSWAGNHIKTFTSTLLAEYKKVTALSAAPEMLEKSQGLDI